MTATLAQLVTPQNATYYFNLLMGVCQSAGFPVQSWQVGGVERTRLMAMATALADKATNYAPQIAAGILLDYSSSDGNGGGWLPLTAQEFYNLTQNAATYTQGSITLTSAAGVGSQTVAAGGLIAVFGATGKRYLNTASVTIPAGPGSVSGTFQAENPGSSYSDPSNSGAITLATPIPGVTLTNPAGMYSAQIGHVGSGTGTLTLGGSPVGPHQVVVRIDTTGASGTSSWSYSLDGAAYVSAGIVATLNNLGGVGINVTLTNGASGTSFAQGDTYTFYAPGSWITQQGSDIESDPMLVSRCRARWAGLANIAVNNLYYLLATSTPSVGSQVTAVYLENDATINNKINIVVVGPAGPLPAATVSAIQTWINAKAALTDNANVVSPTTQAITYAGTVTVSASQLTASQTAINTALNAYTSTVGTNGTLRIAAVIDDIMNVSGVVDATGITINGSGSNLTLGGVGSYVFPTPVTINLTYVTQ